MDTSSCPAGHNHSYPQMQTGCTYMSACPRQCIGMPSVKRAHLRQCTWMDSNAISNSAQIAYCSSGIPSRWTKAPEISGEELCQQVSQGFVILQYLRAGFAFFRSAMHNGQNTGNRRSLILAQTCPVIQDIHNRCWHGSR